MRVSFPRGHWAVSPGLSSTNTFSMKGEGNGIPRSCLLGELSGREGSRVGQQDGLHEGPASTMGSTGAEQASEGPVAHSLGASRPRRCV